MDISAGPMGNSAIEARQLRLGGLHRLSAAVNRAEVVSQIYDAAIAALLESLGADRAAILLYDNEGVMRFVAASGLSTSYQEAVEGHSPWTRDCTDPQPVLVPDVYADPDLQDYLPIIRREGIRALGFIPLMYRSRLLGKFMVYFNEAHEFSDEEMMMAQTIANHVAFAIEQKRTELSLRLYRQIFEHAPLGIGVVDLNGKYIEQNPAHRSMIGYSADELRNQTPAIHLGPDGFGAIIEGLAASDTFQSEMVSRAKDGNRFDIDLSAFVVRDDVGDPVCFVGIKHDISLRKEAERKIRLINTELEERVQSRTADLVRAKEDMEGFCYSVSHDLRAPLRGMNTSAKMLLEDYSDKLDDGGKHHLRRLAEASVRMAKLIDDLLEYSRLGRKEPDRMPLDLSSLVERLVEEMGARNEVCRSMQVEIASAPLVEADPQLMEILLHNLLENACKFTAGRPDARLEFGHRAEAGRHVFYVRDNGAGFDPQYVGRLFRPFERLHSEAEFPGTGIGLANAKRIIERHRGEIWAEGAVGEGATFYFSLPA